MSPRPSIALVALVPLQHRREVVRDVVDAGVRIALLGQPRRHRAEGEVERRDVRQLVPGQRGRDRGLRDRRSDQALLIVRSRAFWL